MVDLQQYEEYWSGITERIPQIKKVVPVTFDPDMGALVQGLKADELPALLLIIPSAKGKSPDVDNLLELNLCVAFLMDKTDPQRKGTYQVLKELQPVMEKMKAQMIDDKAAGMPPALPSGPVELIHHSRSGILFGLCRMEPGI